MAPHFLWELTPFKQIKSQRSSIRPALTSILKLISWFGRVYDTLENTASPNIRISFKLIVDLVAIPDMGGAMENWGLVTFRESAMLFDPDTGSAADQKLVAMIVNHEFAHQVNCS